MENLRSHRNINIVTTEARSNYLLSKPRYYTTKMFIVSYTVTEST